MIDLNRRHVDRDTLEQAKRSAKMRIEQDIIVILVVMK